MIRAVVKQAQLFRKAVFTVLVFKEIETDGGTVEAFALNLMEDEIGAVILGGEEKVKAGASVRRKGGDLAKLGLSLLDSLLHLVGIADIALVRLNLDAELLSDLLSVLLRIRVRVVKDCNVRTGAGSSLADAETTALLVFRNNCVSQLTCHGYHR